MRIPTEQECMELLREVRLAESIVRHSVTVKNFASEIADDLTGRGIKVDKDLVMAAALLHDIMKIEAQVCHGIEGGHYLRKKGFHRVASVVEKHCLNNLEDQSFMPKTTEEKLLMYADLRVGGGKVISLDERFKSIEERYKPKDKVKFAEYHKFAQMLEKELLGEARK